jgi:hypothetical protein
MRARQLIIETLLKEATEEEKLVAAALDDAFDELEADLKANKDKLAPEMQNEAVGFAIAGSIVSMPALLKLIGKAVAKVQSRLKGEKVETNTIIKVADKLHHLLIGGIEKVLQFVFRIKDKKQAHRLAVIIFHAIVAGLLIASGKAFFKALQKHNTVVSILEGLLSAIKSGELGVFLSQTFGEISQALGLGAELADAADLADAIEATEELSEMSAMSLGAVEVGAGKTNDNLEENKMNKLKITKGRLRQILAEEVARHQKQKLNEAREGDFVEVIGGSLAGAKGKLMEPVTTTTGEAGFAIALTNDADKPVFGKAGDEVVVLTSDIKPLSGMAEYGVLDAMAGNPPSKIGQGNKEYMEQYNDILVFTGRDPLPMKQPDQAYLDALRSGRLEEMGAAEEAAEAAELRAEEEPSSVVNEEALEEGMGSLAAREGFRQGRRAAEDGLNPEEAEAKAKQRALSMSGRELEMLQLTGLESVSPEQYELAMKDALEASASATSDYLTQFARGYHTFRQVSEEKTEKYDDEMKEKFSKKQADELPDELQKAMLKKEVRAMIEEMLKGEGEKTLEGRRPASMRKRTMKDLDDEAKTRETDFLKKKKGEKKEELRKMNEEMLCEECGGVHEGTCPGK